MNKTAKVDITLPSFLNPTPSSPPLHLFTPSSPPLHPLFTTTSTIHKANSPATPRAIQSAIAKAVTIGFTPLALGKTLASATYSPSVPQTFPLGSTTPAPGWLLILQEPI